MGHKFWIVWNPQGREQPRYRHNTRESAEQEAERLARQHRDCRFFVLEAVSVAFQPTVVELHPLEVAPPEDQAQEPKALIHAADHDPFADD